MLFFVLFSLLQDNSDSKDTELYKNRLAVIGLYNRIVRWTRESEEFGVKEGQLSPEAAVLYILGGDFHLLEPFMPEILEKKAQMQVIANITTTEVSLATQSSLEFYSAIHLMVSNKSYGKFTSAGNVTCGSFLSFSQSNLTPNKTHIFNYINVKSSKNKPVGQLIQGYFNKMKSESQLDRNIRDLIEKEQIADALLEIYDLGVKYLGTKKIDVTENFCESNLLDFKVLLALEEQLFLNMDMFDDCLLKLEDEQNPTLELALKYLDTSLADEQLLIAAFPLIDVENVMESYWGLKRVSQNILGLFSLPFVRDLIIGKTVINLCDECTCTLQGKIVKLRKSIGRIKSSLPLGGTMCSDSWDDKTHIPTNIKDFLMHDKEFLLNDIRNLEQIDDIYEVFNSRMKQYYRQPFIGIPFANNPAKRGLWWLASHFFSYENCEQFTEVQRLRKSLERYAEIYYLFDESLFNQCGLLTVTEPIESLMLAIQLSSMTYYELYRRFDFVDLVTELKILNIEYSLVNPNIYQRITSYWFNHFNNDPALSVSQVKYKAFVVERFVQDYIFDDYQSLLEDFYKDKLKIFLDNCGTCEVANYYKKIIDVEYISLVNYAEGRIDLQTYEKDIYFTAKKKAVKRDSSVRLNAGCENSLDEQFFHFKESARRFFGLEEFKDPDVFNLFLTSNGMEIGYSTPDAMFDYFVNIENMLSFTIRIQHQLQKIGNSLFLLVLLLELEENPSRLQTKYKSEIRYIIFFTRVLGHMTIPNYFTKANYIL